MSPTTAPFGSWRSPLTADVIARSRVVLGGPRLSGDVLHWVERRPAEGGRSVIVRRAGSDQAVDVTSPGFNVRTRVHEYGGGEYLVHGDSVFFSNFTDQRLYRQDGPGEDPRPITPEPSTPAAVRYADGRVTPNGELLVCVRERHEAGGVWNEIVALPADGSREPWVLASGHDFFSFPRPSPDGRRLAWTSWDHPRMPWDGTELWMADLSSDGTLGDPRLVAGGPEESIFQPEWSPDGTLHFVSDRTGWWNLYRDREGRIEALHPMDAEFGSPQWIFGFSQYAFPSDGRIACVYSSAGIDHLALLDPATGEFGDVDLPYTDYGYVQASGDRLAFVAASAGEAPAVVVLDVDSGATEVVRRSLSLDVDAGTLSVPRPIEFPTEDGLTAHALYYPPANRDFTVPGGERPPLLVFAHGGPTGHTTSALDLEIQFFTSRGFAVADVNYGGSTGYGRPYRERLKGTWGIVDVADSVNAARYLADVGEVDGRRLAIRGGSAGGWVTLCALAFHDVFAAGASYFGVGDAEGLARHTHKFESRYLDGLIGPYPEAVDIYRERSPVHFADRLSCPLILFQGLEDEVVPPAQAEEMVAALREKGIPYAYLAYEGEQHGFRRAENIERSLQAELYFYGRILGFEPADRLEPVPIENL